MPVAPLPVAADTTADSIPTIELEPKVQLSEAELVEELTHADDSTTPREDKSTGADTSDCDDGTTQPISENSAQQAPGPPDPGPPADPTTISVTIEPQAPKSSDSSIAVDEFGLPQTGADKPKPRRVYEYDHDSDDDSAQKGPDSTPSGAQANESSAPGTTSTSSQQPSQQPSSSAPKAVTISSHSHMVLSGAIPRSSTNTAKKEDIEEVGWQDMPAYAPWDIYDDRGRIIARERTESTDEELDKSDQETRPKTKGSKSTKASSSNGKSKGDDGDGGQKQQSKQKKGRDRFGSGVGNEYFAFQDAGHGYRRVGDDDDVRSVTSLDEETAYLFRRAKPANQEDVDDKAKGSGSDSDDGCGFDYQNGYGHSLADDDYDDDDDDEYRDESTQLAMTKGLLSERERIGYVGLVRVTAAESEAWMSRLVGKNGQPSGAHARLGTNSSNGSGSSGRVSKAKPKTKVDKVVQRSLDGMAMWRQSIALRVYSHMDVSSDEQLMTEQLFGHGVDGKDLAVGLKPGAEDDDSAEVKVDALGGDGTTHKTEGVAKKDNQNDIRWALLCDLLLLLLSDGTYDSRSRDLLFRVAHHLGLPSSAIPQFESKVAHTLELARADEDDAVTADASGHINSRRKRTYRKRLALMGLATIGGGLIIGLSAGILAPVIGSGLAAGFTTIGIAGTGSFLAGAGGAAVVTTSGVVAGSTVGLRAAGRRTGAVESFQFKPVSDSRRLSVVVGVSGWMTGRTDDVRLPFSTLEMNQSDVYALEWEPELLRSMGATITILATEAFTQGLQQILGSTILVSLMAAVQIPILLTKLAYLIDNPWAVSQARADAAGKILADVLISRGMGKRPVTLVGYSLGARLVYSCLLEMARRMESGSDGAASLGIVHDVYIFGAPVVVKKEEWHRVRSVVSGRFVNGYTTSDWILGYLFRATAGGVLPVAGLGGVNLEGQKLSDVNIDIMEKAALEQDKQDKEKQKQDKEKKKNPGTSEADPAKSEAAEKDKKKEYPTIVFPRWSSNQLIENVDCSDLVTGHMAYRTAMPRLLKRVGFAVTADEFAEPEPEEGEKADADAQAARLEKERLDQLLSRVEEAGRDREAKLKAVKESEEEKARKKKKKQNQGKPKKGIWALWSKSKKEDEDTYDDVEEEERRQVGQEQSRDVAPGLAGPPAYQPYDPDGLFDVDAIAAEVAAVAAGNVSASSTADSGTATPASSTLPSLQTEHYDGEHKPEFNHWSNAETHHGFGHDDGPGQWMAGPGDDSGDTEVDADNEPDGPVTLTFPNLGSLGLEPDGHNVWADPTPVHDTFEAYRSVIRGDDDIDEFAEQPDGQVSMTFA